MTSSFGVRAWEGVRLLGDALSDASPALQLVAQRSDSIPDPPLRSIQLKRRGSLTVARDASGLHLRTGTGEVAWMGFAAPASSASPILRVERAPGRDRAQFERVLGNCLVPNVLAARGHWMLHAAAVVVSGRVVLFCGDSGAGKSTLAAGFADAGLAVLSDDVVRLAPASDGRVFAFPSYPGLHLRAESFLQAEGGVHSATAKWWRPIAASDPVLCSGVEVSAMYGLRRQFGTVPHITPLAPIDAIQQWMRAMFADAVSRDRRARYVLATAGTLTSSTPSFALSYRRSARHFPQLLAAIVAHASAVPPAHEANPQR